MEAVAQRYADDREARIFYALSLLATADGLDKWACSFCWSGSWD
jgi:hypothetical protein